MSVILLYTNPRLASTSLRRQKNPAGRKVNERTEKLTSEPPAFLADGPRHGTISRAVPPG